MLCALPSHILVMIMDSHELQLRERFFFCRLSVVPAPVSHQSLRITSTVSMQLRPMKYHARSCNITIWNMQYQYHTMQGNMKPWQFYEAYIHFQLRRFFSRLQNLLEPFHLLELHERCHLREGASRPWETSEKMLLWRKFCFVDTIRVFRLVPWFPNCSFLFSINSVH